MSLSVIFTVLVHRKNRCPGPGWWIRWKNFIVRQVTINANGSLYASLLSSESIHPFLLASLLSVQLRGNQANLAPSLFSPSLARFGETLPQPPNILQVTPFETSQRRLRHVADYVTYSRLYATLPAAHLAGLKSRVRSGDPKAVKELWERRDKTFLAVDFELNERNERTVLEWGYAALRCGHFDA